MLGKLARSGRQQPNALLLFLNLLWDTDDHVQAPEEQGNSAHQIEKDNARHRTTRPHKDFGRK